LRKSHTISLQAGLDQIFDPKNYISSECFVGSGHNPDNPTNLINPSAGVAQLVERRLPKP
jgi:hypothetical protein